MIEPDECDETTLRFLIYDVAIAVQTSSATALDGLRRLYGAFAAPSGVNHNVFFRIAPQDNGWAISDGAEKRFQATALSSVMYEIEAMICQRVADVRSDLLTVHGASLWTPRGGMLITGPSGAGKSTLSLALSSLGWKVCTDDYSLLDGVTGQLLPVPRFFHLDAASLRLLESVGVDLSANGRSMENLTPADLGWPGALPLDVRWIVYIDGSSDPGRPPVRPVTQAEMLAHLSTESGRTGVRWEQDLARLARLPARSACFRMDRADLRKMISELGQLFRMKPDIL